MGWLSAIASIGSALIGSSMAKSSSNKQMRFQERMSNTSYQRAVEDMRAAGLNPMLAYEQGGASTPPGSSYQPQPFDAGEAFQKATSAKQTRELQKQQVDQSKSAVAVNAKQAEYLDKQATKAAADTKVALADELLRGQQLLESKANTAVAQKQLERMAADIESVRRDVRIKDAEAFKQEAMKEPWKWLKDLIDDMDPRKYIRNKTNSARDARDNYIPPSSFKSPQANEARSGQ